MNKVTITLTEDQAKCVMDMLYNSLDYPPITAELRKRYQFILRIASKFLVELYPDRYKQVS